MYEIYTTKKLKRNTTCQKGGYRHHQRQLASTISPGKAFCLIDAVRMGGRKPGTL